MTNVKTRIEGDKLIIEVNLAERNGVSASGKSILIASSNGNQPLPPPHGAISFGLNIYTKK
jgi:hypothetical protein